MLTWVKKIFFCYTDSFWLFNKPIAHRGLWNEQIIENSIPAYKNAVEKGYPIEIDVFLSKDNVFMSFHDSTLTRMTGKEGYIYDKTYSELKSLRLKNSDEQIPSLDEVLELCQGKVPLLIEIKKQPNKNVVDLLCEKLKNYTGKFAIQSFNPFYIKRVKKIAPNFIRGILGTENAEDEKPFTKRVLKNLSFNFLCKPQFISYRHTGLPLKKIIRKNLPVIAWTITDEESYKKVKPFAKNIIFEGFIPKT